MIFLGSKNDALEYKSLEEYQNNINKLLANDAYISKKDYLPFYNANKEIYEKLHMLDDENVLSSWCKNNHTDYNALKNLLNFYSNTLDIIKNYNNKFIQSHLVNEKEYLDNILIKDDPNIKLDNEQREVVLADEDYTLVIAGAGAGKTTTIEAKVKYLIDKKNVEPEKILIVSFTNKATKELQDRCKRLGLPVKISTFHSIANTIIADSEEQKHKIATTDFMFVTIKNFLIKNLNDESFIKKILLFFASYLQIPFDDNSLEVLFNELSKNECTTLKSDLASALNKYQDKLTKSKTTILNEKVRSVEECRIANFLFINGIQYEYEPIYKYGFDNTTKPYCPDFLIRQYDKEIYLEHFGISEDGKNNRFSEKELTEYKKHINDKILLHRKHHTNLIYTFSKYLDGKDTLTHLKEELIKAGISFEPKNSKEIYKAIIENAEDKYFNKFIQLVCVFISRFKTNNFAPSKFDEWNISIKDERTKLFIHICYQCYMAYMTELKNTNSIDFEDMINNAANILDNKIKNGEMLPYDYIFIDEYQDISMQRFDLCEKLAKCSNAKIIAVGDDWQSIFRFSGAKLELFTRFEEIMGYANILKITNTYRNSQELIDIAGSFVMSNASQIKKSLKSNKRIKYPLVLMSYDDSNEKNEYNETSLERMIKTIQKSLDYIVKQNGDKQKILIVGRYGFEGYFLGKYPKYFIYTNNNNIQSVKYPNLQITYLTAHSSKGLGYDNVIIMNGKDAILGFPSKIVDDPVMKLVIKDDENYDFAEERRLFYVALTRTKNRVFIITPKYKPSKFILELKENYQDIYLDGEELQPSKTQDYIVKCPYCGYPMQKRINSNFKVSKKIWVCSNDPEVCGFITNDLKGGKLAISKCPKCEDGYLIVKPIKNKNGDERRMLGCSNYKADGSGCSFYMLDYNYTQDKEEIMLNFNNEDVNIDNALYCGHNFKDMVNTTIKVASEYQNLKMAVGPKILFSILKGEETNPIIKFNLNKNAKFGYITDNSRKKFYNLLNALISNGIIKIDKDDYNRIIVLKDKLDENDYKVIFADLKF